MPLLRTLCRFPGLSDAVQPFLSSASQWLADPGEIEVRVDKR